jgi:serine/threonine protein kinase
LGVHFQEGGQVGDYCLLRRLAMGGMGEIWLAERKGYSGFSKRVVIKTILEAFSDDPELVEMFLEEGRIAAGLTHPNIAQTFDLGKVGSVYYIAMEYVAGKDLRNILLSNIERRQHIPLNLVLRIVSQTCEGLYYAHNWTHPDGHKAGVIHRDISPQNILVTFDGTVKVVDFGIAKAAHRVGKTRSGVLKGKYAYMAPEQVRGQGADHRIDLWALGVVMYELCTSRRLFKRDSEMATLDAVMEAQVPSITRLDGSIPASVERVLMKALAKNPDRRYRDAREMQMALEEVMLAENLPASSAHLSAYLEKLFQGQEELKPGSISRMDRQMECLPSAVDKDERELERTRPFTPGLDLDSVSRKVDLPTRNLLVPGRAGARRPRLSPAVFWLGVGLVAVGLSALAFWLVMGRAPEPTDQAAEGLTLGPPEAGEPARPDAGDEPDGGELGLGLDLAEPEDGGPPGEDQAVAVAVARGPALLTVLTEPAADIFLGPKKLGRGSVRAVPVAPGKHVLKVVVGPCCSRQLSLSLRPGERAERRVVFQTGSLSVVVFPWANVFVDGRERGQTPIAPLELLEGTHRIRLVNPELGKETEKTIKIKPGAEASLRVDWR